MDWKEEEIEKRRREKEQRNVEMDRKYKQRSIISQKVPEFYQKLIISNNALPFEIRLPYTRNGKYINFYLNNKYTIGFPYHGNNKAGYAFITYDIDNNSLCLINYSWQEYLFGYISIGVADYYYIDDYSIDNLLKNACCGKPIYHDLKYYKTEKRNFMKYRLNKLGLDIL